YIPVFTRHDHPCCTPYATVTTETSTLSLHDALPISFTAPVTLEEYIQLNSTVFLSTCLSISEISIFPVAGLLFKTRNSNPRTFEDRKSTRLNSSHVSNSYAVYCLKYQLQSQHLFRAR